MYGMFWDIQSHNETSIELYCFLNADGLAGQGQRLSRVEHFWNCCDLIWNNNPLAPASAKVHRNDWSHRMAVGMIENAYCSLAGCASSGKSHMMAALGIINYLASPLNTKVVMSSTTLTAARDRIWKSVSVLWLDSFPGKMVQSKCLIRGYNDKGKLSDETGLKLIAPGGTASSEIDPAFIGLKQERFLVFLDELSELPMGVLNACYSNLDNNFHFEMKAASNPNLYTDPFGVFSRPVGGWTSVAESDDEWETSRGVCLRFDSERSPNIEAGEILFPWLPKQKSIDSAVKDFGRRSRAFYRMHKAFWFADASDETIYTEGELLMCKADQPIDDEEFGGKDPQEVFCAGGDPAYTQGGDRFPVVIGRVVQIDGKSVLEVTDVEMIDDDIESKEANRSYHSVREMEQICSKYSIDPENFGFDMTGAGIPFRDIVVSEWSSLPLGVNFGGSPSKLQISPVDKRLANEVYSNRVSELWVRMKGLLREGRIRGIPEEMIAEISQRRWHDIQSKGKLRIESKVLMKKRGLKSPDLGDSLFVLLETAIRRGLMGEMEEVKLDKRGKDAWFKVQSYHDVVELSDLDLSYD